MDSLIYILFICIAVPLMLMLGLLDKKSRLVLFFMIIGIFLCMYVSEINGLIERISDKSYLYITTTFTPITEEIAKAIPVLFFAFLFSDDREKLISISMATGIGFAILENAYILSMNIESVSIFWALIRAFGSGLMHGLCTAMVGIGASFIRKRRKLFYTGSFALLTLAIVYHACYNLLVQSRWANAGFLLPLFTYIPIVFFLAKSQIQKTKRRKYESLI